MIDLKGKVALLTASGQGIGKATAKAFSEAGAYVIATDINYETLSSLDKIVDETHILDVTDNNEIKKLIRSIKEPDILFNCAGVVHNGTILESSDDDWDFAFNLNGKAMYHMIKEVIPIMIKKGGGSIVNIASVVGLKGVSYMSGYGAAKAGLINFSRASAIEAAPFVRVNCIIPGAVETPATKRAIPSDEMMEATAQSIPLKRIAHPDEIAHPIIFLLSNDASFITGSSLIVDGGKTADLNAGN